MEKDDLFRFLSKTYDIEMSDITPVKNVMRISTKSGDKCLKKIKYDEPQFLFVLSAMEHLLKNRFSKILPFVPSADGALYFRFESNFYYMTEWINSRECDYSNPVELRMASVSLAELHESSKNFNPGAGAGERIAWGRWESKFGKRIRDMQSFKDIIDSKKTLTYFDRLYRENIDYFIGQGISSIEHLNGTKYLQLMADEMKKKSFCHHDYAHHNVLISSDFKLYLIDFDYCICDTRIHDLSSLIIRNLRHGNWDMEKARFIIDCYCKKGYLTEDEVPVMNAFMEFPQDFWQVGLQYYVEKLKWEEDHFNKRLERVIDDIPDRQLFLNEFKYSIEV